MKLDLESFDSVRNFVVKLEELFPNEPLDILINNAGSMIHSRKVTGDGYEAMLQTNCLSTFLLTVLLIPKLKAASSPRIVSVSSSTSRLHTDILFDDLLALKRYNIFYTYSHSKFALNVLMIELSKRLEGIISINLCHPGAIKTKITRHLHPVIQTAHILLLGCFFKAPVHGAQTAIHLAVHPTIDRVTGNFFEHCQVSSAPIINEPAIKFFELAEKAVDVNVSDYLK